MGKKIAKKAILKGGGGASAPKKKGKQPAKKASGKKSVASKRFKWKTEKIAGKKKKYSKSEQIAKFGSVLKQDAVIKVDKPNTYPKAIKDAIKKGGTYKSFDKYGVVIPQGAYYDRAKKRFFYYDGRYKTIKKLIGKNPSQFIIGGNRIYDYSKNRFVKRNTYLNNNGSLRSGYTDDYSLYGSAIIKKTPFGGDYKESKLIKRNNGVRIFKTFKTKSDNMPTNMGDFAELIKNKAFSSFTEEQRRKPNMNIYLRFGDAFQKVSFDELVEKSLWTIVDNQVKNKFGYEEWLSALEGEEGEYEDLVSETIDLSFFRIELSGTYQGGGNKAKALKYFYHNQPITKNNTCIEGAIRRALDGNTPTWKMREEMINFSKNEIKKDEMISLSKLHYYENKYKININVFSDLPHYIKNGNQLLHSPSNYEKSVDVCLANDHYSIITGKKFIIENGLMPKKNYTHEEQIALFGKLIKNEIIKEVKPIKEKKIKIKLKERLCVFDIETIYDLDGANLLKAYSISCFVWDADEIFEYDENIHTKEPYCYYWKGEDCLSEFLEFLLTPPDGIIYKPVGFNNSRFDNFAVCCEAMGLGLLRNSFFVDGSILYMVIDGVRPSWDACRFLNSSLDNACKSYNTNPKKRKDLIDHYEIQTYYEKNGFDGLMNLIDEDEGLVLYNKLDVISLLDLTLKMRESYKEVLDEDIFESFTLSSMGYKHLQKIWDGKYGKTDANVKPAKSYNIDKFWRDSLTAGRTQSFYGAIDLKMPIAMCDVKSLYPTVMLSTGDNDCPFPNGEARLVNKEEPNKLGIYRVDVIHQKCKWVNEDIVNKQFKTLKEKYGYDLYRKYAPNVIPRRTDDEPLDWFWKDEMKDINLTSVDISVLRKATGDPNCVKVKWGYVWDDMSYELFTDFLNPLKEGKTQQDELKRKREIVGKENPNWNDDEIRDYMELQFGEDYNEALREGNKNGSNAISGKLLEKIHDDICEVFNLKQFIKYERDEGVKSVEITEFGGGFSLISGKKDKEAVYNDTKEKKRKPAHLGMFVYSYARRLMYEKLLSKYITLYMDTDSGALPLIEYDRMNNENVENDLMDNGEYGCFEEEVSSFMMCDSCLKMKERSLESGDRSEIIHYRMENRMIDGSRCKKCLCIPADRLIAISPKNYLVENSSNQKFSKRKFKGVRKNDFWLPISHFKKPSNDKILENKILGLTENEKCIKRIQNLKQSEIRRFREFKCCVECINREIKDENDICENCKKVKSLMKKTYTTEMFETLVRGEKIAIFCSIINRIKYKIEDIVEWEYEEMLDRSTDIKTYEMIFNDYEGKTQKQPIQMKYTVDKRLHQEYFEKMKNRYTKINKQFKNLEKNANEDELKAIKAKKKTEMDKWFRKNRRFNVCDESRKLKDAFKLKQQFLVKII